MASLSMNWKTTSLHQIATKIRGGISRSYVFLKGDAVVICSEFDASNADDFVGTYDRHCWESRIIQDLVESIHAEICT